MFKYLKKKHSVSSLYLTIIFISAIVIIFLLLSIFPEPEKEAVKRLILPAILIACLVIIIVGIILWPGRRTDTSDSGNPSADLAEPQQVIINDLQNEKKYFAGILSHDLRSPLSSIILLASYLKSKNEHPEVNHYIDLIEQSSRKELEMMATLLSLIRADVSKPENREELNLKSLAENIIESSEVQLSRKLLTTHLNIAPGATIVAEAEAFALIFKNLINQAICYSDQGQMISILSSEKENIITIELSIQSHELPKIIDQDLFKSDRLTLQSAVNGFPDCIDLYFSQKALNNYNGTIRVQADGNGPSCRFIMTLDRLKTQHIV